MRLDLDPLMGALVLAFPRHVTGTDTPSPGHRKKTGAAAKRQRRATSPDQRVDQ
jgi:hypothetical protein